MTTQTNDIETIRLKLADLKGEREELKKPRHTREANIERRARLAEVEAELQRTAVALLEAEAAMASEALPKLHEALQAAQAKLTEIDAEAEKLDESLRAAIGAGDVDRVGSVRLVMNGLPARRRAAQLVVVERLGDIAEVEHATATAEAKGLQVELKEFDLLLAGLQTERGAMLGALSRANERLADARERARNARERAATIKAELTAPTPARSLAVR
jgi:chromosome segregation ATPase